MSNSEQSKNLDALVLFSGGQDSAVCLAWALNRYKSVYTIGFNYNQRHNIELTCRKKFLDTMKKAFPTWSSKIKDDFVIDLEFMENISDSALTEKIKISNSVTPPNTFLPGRNILFFSVAATLAAKLSIDKIVGGMCQTDFSGYPDCRNDTLKTLEKALKLGFEKPFEIVLPLMFLDKCETWIMAKRLGGATLVDVILEETHTCYEGVRSNRNIWGYGCGDCPACLLRKKGYETFISKESN